MPIQHGIAVIHIIYSFCYLNLGHGHLYDVYKEFYLYNLNDFESTFYSMFLYLK